MIFDIELSPPFYFFIANAFIAPIHIVWIYALSDFLFPARKKLLVAIFSIEAIAFETLFLLLFFLDPLLIGDQKSYFVVEWAIWIQIYLLGSIALFLITGFLFARRSLKSPTKDLKLKGKFLIIAFDVVIIGGLGSLFGTFLGGIILGLVQTIAGYYFGSAAQMLFVYSAVLLVLIVKPQGLFGR